jgi:hypothetical protein
VRQRIGASHEHLLSLTDSLRDKIIANKVLDEAELDKHRDALAQHVRY